MSTVYVKPQFAKAIDKAINQNKSISDKPGKLDSSLKVLKKIGKAYNHSLPLGFQWLWLKHNLDLLTPYQVKYFNRKKGTSAWKRKGSGDMASLKEKVYNIKQYNYDLSKFSDAKKDKLVDILKDKYKLKRLRDFIHGDRRYNDISINKKSISPKVMKDIERKFGLKQENTMKEARGTCWVGYQQIGMKKKNGKMVPNCVKENVDIYYEENGKGYGYTFEFITDKSLQEAEYQGRKVKLNKIMQGDAKKFKVYVKNPKGNVVKVNFGQGGKAKGGTMRIRKSNPKARANFRARHNCDNPGPKHKARYWACRTW